ncbi:unnamed protein product [Ixodes persulcatus]
MSFETSPRHTRRYKTLHRQLMTRARTIATTYRQDTSRALWPGQKRGVHSLCFYRNVGLSPVTAVSGQRFTAYTPTPPVPSSIASLYDQSLSVEKSKFGSLKWIRVW